MANAERSISWNLYAVAFVISLLLFGAGFLLGLQLTQGVNEGLRQELEVLKARTAELELLSLLKQNSSVDLCPLYGTHLQQFDVQTTEFGQKIDYLERSRGREDAAVQSLKREYLQMQVRDYLLVQRINQECPQKISTILFFYTNQNCPECTRQGEIGPPLKKEMPNVMIYAFDADLGSAAVQALEKIYGVRSYPALVVNGKTLEGYQPKEKVESLLKGG